MLTNFLIALFAALFAVQGAAFLIYISARRKAEKSFFPPLSVLIPAHNEEKDIAATLKSILSNGYAGKKEIIVIDDGSTDNTADAVRRIAGKHKGVRLLSIQHSGKASALNCGLKAAKFDCVAILDADSALEKGSLRELVAPLDRCSAASGIIRAKCTKNPLTWLQDIDYIISSGWRATCSKINANYSMPGFAAFRKDALLSAGGFSRDTLTEDLDIGLALRKAGHKTTMTAATMRTTVPATPLRLLKQRFRWGRGSIQTAKKHSDMLFSRRFAFVGTYAFPMHLFWHVFALLYLPLLFYWFLGDYFSYFLASGAAYSFDALLFLVRWLTIYGVAELLYGVAAGTYALTSLTAAILASWLVSFAYFLMLVLRLSRASWRTFAAYVIVFPYYWFILAVQGASTLYELFSRKRALNRWDKN